MPAVINELFIV